MERSLAGSRARAYKWPPCFFITRPQMSVQCHIRTSFTNLSPLLHPSPKDFPPLSLSLCTQSYLIYFRWVTFRLDHLLKGLRNLRWRSKISHILGETILGGTVLTLVFRQCLLVYWYSVLSLETVPPWEKCELSVVKTMNLFIAWETFIGCVWSNCSLHPCFVLFSVVERAVSWLGQQTTDHLTTLGAECWDKN